MAAVVASGGCLPILCFILCRVAVGVQVLVWQSQFLAAGHPDWTCTNLSQTTFCDACSTPNTAPSAATALRETVLQSLDTSKAIERALAACEKELVTNWLASQYMKYSINSDVCSVCASVFRLEPSQIWPDKPLAEFGLNPMLGERLVHELHSLLRIEATAPALVQSHTLASHTVSTLTSQIIEKLEMESSSPRLMINNQQLDQAALNKLTPLAISTCRYVRILDLAHNQLMRLPEGMLEEMTGLQKIDLSHNQLQVINQFQHVLHHDSLRHVDLSSNSLVSIDNAVARLPVAFELLLGGNEKLNQPPLNVTRCDQHPLGHADISAIAAWFAHKVQE